MGRPLDIVFIQPNASHEIYQGLARDFSAIEPPIWAALMANHVRSRGFNPEIIDCEAMGFSDEDALYHLGNMKPRVVAFGMYGQQPSASAQNMEGAVRLAGNIKSTYPKIKILFFGIFPSALPRETLEAHSCIDFVCTNEGVYTISNLLKTDLENNLKAIKGLVWRKEVNDDTSPKDYRIIINEAAEKVKQEDLEKELPGMAWDLLPMERYRTSLWHSYSNDTNRKNFASLYTSLGCPFSCLRGDTLINTIYGDISIRELSEKYKNVPVYTYDINQGRVVIAEAINIQKTGINKKLVRVHFKDGTHIDCTPDHRFLVFQQYVKDGGEEYEVEAKDLKLNMSVRAFKLENSGYDKRISISWGKRKRQKRSCMIMEYLLERPLKRTEHVHHKDKNVRNDHPYNLEYCDSAKTHSNKHPEVRERMHKLNPAFHMTEEWKKNISKKGKGKNRTLEQRIRYSNSKKGNKNPNWKGGHSLPRSKSRLEKQVNHKVSYVEILLEKEDVYCMEVPKYNWFFANKVLVHNCSFCCINQPFGGSSFRFWRPEFTINELDRLAKMGITNLKIADEMFVMRPDHFMRLCELIIERGYKFNIWAYARVDITKPQYLETLKKAGVNWLALGIESGNKAVRKGVIKGRFDDVDIVSVVNSIRNSGINVIGNYIFGLPDDNKDTMQETLDLALEMNTEEANFYSAMAYPGSKLHLEAIAAGTKLPDRYAGYSQHSYYTQPLPTKYLTAAEVLKFRDEAWLTYHTNPAYLELILNKFGSKAKEEVYSSIQIKLKRRLLGN